MIKDVIEQAENELHAFERVSVATSKRLISEVLTLREELSYWALQKGCECGHPACSNCKDTKDARKLLNT